MKTLIESIFDDDQTYIDKSGYKDPIDLILEDKHNRDDSYKQTMMWLEQNKLVPTDAEIKRINKDAQLPTIIYQIGDGSLSQWSQWQYLFWVNAGSGVPFIAFHIYNKGRSITIRRTYPKKYKERLTKILIDLGYDYDRARSTIHGQRFEKEN